MNRNHIFLKGDCEKNKLDEWNGKKKTTTEYRKHKSRNIITGNGADG